jgi:hypothetical protein
MIIKTEHMIRIYVYNYWQTGNVYYGFGYTECGFELKDIRFAAGIIEESKMLKT